MSYYNGTSNNIFRPKFTPLFRAPSPSLIKWKKVFRQSNTFNNNVFRKVLFGSKYNNVTWRNTNTYILNTITINSTFSNEVQVCFIPSDCFSFKYETTFFVAVDSYREGFGGEQLREGWKVIEEIICYHKCPFYISADFIKILYKICFNSFHETFLLHSYSQL